MSVPTAQCDSLNEFNSVQSVILLSTLTFPTETYCDI